MDYRLVVAFLVLVVVGYFLLSGQPSRVYQPQSMYVVVLTDPHSMDKYRVSVAWRSPDPTAVRGPYEDRNNGVIVFQFDLPYAPDINEVTVLYPGYVEGSVVFRGSKRVNNALVVVDISPGNRAYVSVCSDASVYLDEHNLVRYIGLCSGPFVITPGSVSELNALEVFP